MTPIMHEGETEITEQIVRQLVAGQFPEWAAMPVERVASRGTDNALFRLGEELVARMPRVAWAARQVAKEHLWLPRLSPSLPLPIPSPVAMGAPGEGYPRPWSIYRWIEGEAATAAVIDDPIKAALRLADFSVALRGVDATGGPLPGEHNSGRGVPLQDRDAAVRKAISQLVDMIDSRAVMRLWERALEASPWEGAGVWIHGDLQPGNLLVRDRRLAAVIDFGCLGVGDPACDLMPAWSFFDVASRAVFREAVGVDDATWERGKGWALSCAVIYIPYYAETNPEGVALARKTVEELVSCPP